GIKDKYVHAFTDGRDVDPNSGKGFVAEIETHLKEHNGKLASIIGRYFAMDRDRRWERVQKAYDLILHGKGTPTRDAQHAIQESYDRQITDEFLEPIVLTDEHGQPVATLKEDEV